MVPTDFQSGLKSRKVVGLSLSSMKGGHIASLSSFHQSTQQWEGRTTIFPEQGKWRLQGPVHQWRILSKREICKSPLTLGLAWRVDGE